MNESFGVYIHIPFCTKKCPYCDFNTYALKNIPETEYVDALILEIKNSKNLDIWKNREVSTIYFGGGTPSILKIESIVKILLCLSDCFLIKSDIEITLEANPGDLNFEKLLDLKSANINRISFGVQTFNNSHLKTLGRWHTAEDAKEIFYLARKAKFDNISLDLMFALPKQNKSQLEADLIQYISLEPEHISTYELTIERGTPFFTRYENKRECLPSHEQSSSMYDLVIDELQKAKYKWYEISNFSKANYESRHNLSYWEGKDYLGIGASAHSFFKKNKVEATRNANVSKVDEYIKIINDTGYGAAWSENLTKRERFQEVVSLSLRTEKGISFETLNSYFECDYIDIVKEYTKNGLLNESDSYLVATRKGRCLADSLTNAILEKINI